MLRSCRVLTGLATLALLCGPSCRRKVEVSEATYRETVSAFYTGLAALQTSQEVLARQKFDRVTTLVPDEPAGWANLGLLLLRQQEIDAGLREAPEGGRAGPEERSDPASPGPRGEPTRATCPRPSATGSAALALDPGDAKAAFALAQETERQGGRGQRGRGPACARNPARALREPRRAPGVRAPVGEAGRRRRRSRRPSRPSARRRRRGREPAREQLAALQQAAARGTHASAAPLVAFLKNVLVRVPEYRRALARGEHAARRGGRAARALPRASQNPEPEPAPPDEALAFHGRSPMAGPGAAWVGAVSLSGEGAPVVVAAAPGRWRG